MIRKTASELVLGDLVDLDNHEMHKFLTKNMRTLSRHLYARVVRKDRSFVEFDLAGERAIFSIEALRDATLEVVK